MADQINSDGICKKETAHSSITNSNGSTSSGTMYWNTIVMKNSTNYYVFFGYRQTAGFTNNSWYPNGQITVQKNWSTTNSFDFKVESSYPDWGVNFVSNSLTIHNLSLRDQVHYFITHGNDYLSYFPNSGYPATYRSWSAGPADLSTATMATRGDFAQYNGSGMGSGYGDGINYSRLSIGTDVAQIKVSYTKCKSDPGQSSSWIWIAESGDPSKYHYNWEPFSHEFIFASGPRIWNGSTWKNTIAYVWNGSAWKQAVAYVWNGSAWKNCG